jgi:radical SAM protein with 4Fe4S-binding SPASM domain
MPMTLRILPNFCRRAARRFSRVTGVGGVAQRELVARLCRETLGRDAHAEELARWAPRWKIGGLSEHHLREILRNGSEYQDFVKPLSAAIKAEYARFHLPEPTPLEIARHVGHFRAEFNTPEECALAAKGDDIRKHLGIRPLKVEIDLTNKCNLRCAMCYFSDEVVFQRKRQDISVEDFARIAEQVFPFCKDVGLSFGTEPLLHRQFGELLAITKSHRVPWVWATTNGILLNDKVIDQVIRLGLDSICISIDGATKQTYERIRVGSNFDKLIANIEALNRAKEQSRSDTPHVQLNFVLMRSNIEELPALIQLAHQLKAGTVGAVHMVSFENAAAKEESLAEHKELSNRMLDEARALALHYKIVANLPENFTPPVSPPSQGGDTGGVGSARGNFFYGLNLLEDETSLSCCRFPWHFVGIDPYGNVTPCGWWYGEEPMGNVKSQPFWEIWNNERYRALRAEHLSRALRPTCQSCPAAGLGRVNDNASFLVKTPMKGYSRKAG